MNARQDISKAARTIGRAQPEVSGRVVSIRRLPGERGGVSWSVFELKPEGTDTLSVAVAEKPDLATVRVGDNVTGLVANWGTVGSHLQGLQRHAVGVMTVHAAQHTPGNPKVRHETALRAG